MRARDELECYSSLEGGGQNRWTFSNKDCASSSPSLSSLIIMYISTSRDGRTLITWNNSHIALIYIYFSICTLYLIERLQITWICSNGVSFCISGDSSSFCRSLCFPLSEPREVKYCSVAFSISHLSTPWFFFKMHSNSQFVISAELFCNL